MAETLKSWKILGKKEVVISPWLKVYAEKIELPSGKILEPFYSVQQPDWVLILARTVQGLWILTRQYRHGIGTVCLEFPAGMMDSGETSLQTAQRELLEETGYGRGHWKTLQVLPVNPDRQSTHFHLVLAWDVEFMGETQWEDSEEIQVSLVSTEDLEQRIKQQQMIHPHHLLAWLLNREALKAL